MVTSVANLARSRLIGSEPNYIKPTKQAEIPEQISNAVNRVFQRLKVIFPAWKTAFADENDYAEAKRYWLETLIAEGITVYQLKNGIEQARLSNNPFFPSLGQFIEWCKTDNYAQYGLPNEEKLLARIKQFMHYGMEYAYRFKFASDVEYWLITVLYERNRKGKWDEQKLRLEISRELKRWVDKIKQGEAIPKPCITLPEKEQPIDYQKNVQRWANLKKILNGVNHGI